MFYIIIIVAVGIIVYFSLFGEKSTDYSVSESQISDEMSVETVVDAVVAGKDISESGTRQHYLTYYVKFECDDGQTREFSVDLEIFRAVELGERDTLVFRNSMFLGFGGHGTVETTEDDFDGTVGDFSYDDYDDSIDIEQSPQFDSYEPLGEDDSRDYKLFRGSGKLPTNCETVKDEMENVLDYDPIKLLQKTTLYPFLKRESEVCDIFNRTYKEAIYDMLGYDGDSRKGLSADSIYLNKNEIRVMIAVEQLPKPLTDKITAEIGINE